MPLLLWAKPSIFAATTLPDFIDWLRYRAIDFGMPPQFIDCVDDLRRLSDADAEIAELQEERDQILTALEDLIEAVNGAEVPDAVDEAATTAQEVLDHL